MTTHGPLFSRTVVARIALTTIVVAPTFVALTAYQTAQERSQRIKAIAVQGAKLGAQQRQIDQQQAKIDQAIIDLRKAKIDSCNDVNKAIKAQITTEYRKDVNLMARLFPQPRSSLSTAIANTFITVGVKSVKDANPYHDCSAKALGILPVPPPTSTTPTTTAGSRSPPKVSRAGTTAVTATTVARVPRTTTTLRGHRRRPPPRPHP